MWFALKAPATHTVHRQEGGSVCSRLAGSRPVLRGRRRRVTPVHVPSVHHHQVKFPSCSGPYGSSVAITPVLRHVHSTEFTSHASKGRSGTEQLRAMECGRCMRKGACGGLSARSSREEAGRFKDRKHDERLPVTSAPSEQYSRPVLSL